MKEVKPKKIKKVKEVILNDIPPISNRNWNDDFKWIDYPDDMDEKILEWYNTPYYQNIISK